MIQNQRFVYLGLACLAYVCCMQPVHAQLTRADNNGQKISATEGGFRGTLTTNATFGAASTPYTDLDGDGIQEVVIGAPGSGTGTVWLLFLNSDGSVRDQWEVGSSSITGLDTGDAFGSALAAVDLDADGRRELLVGAPGDDDGGRDRGAVWVISIRPTGMVSVVTKISATSGGFVGRLNDEDGFGAALEVAFNVRRAGSRDVLVGAPGTDDGGTDRGALWMLGFDGTAAHLIEATKKISATSGDIKQDWDDRAAFGAAVAFMGDVDRDDLQDIAVGAPLDDDGTLNAGAVWFLSIDADYDVVLYEKVSSPTVLQPGDGFGHSIAAIGDVDENGIVDLVFGAPGDDAGGRDRGALWYMLLGFRDGDLAIEEVVKVSFDRGGRERAVADGDQIGASVSFLGDIDGDGGFELAVGASGSDDGAEEAGAAWILFHVPFGEEDDSTPEDFVLEEYKVSDVAGGFGGRLDDGDQFGWSTTYLGNVRGQKIVATGAPFADAGRGAVWLTEMNADGTVAETYQVSNATGGLPDILLEGDQFGYSLEGLPDLNDDGIPELAVGAPGDDSVLEDAGAVWILSFNRSFEVQAFWKIADGASGFPADTLDAGDAFGTSLANWGSELAIGAPGDDDAVDFGVTPQAGAVWLLNLHDLPAPDEIVAQVTTKISNAHSLFCCFPGDIAFLDNLEHFGISIAYVQHDILAVGATDEEDGFDRPGGVWLITLNDERDPDFIHEVSLGAPDFPEGLSIGDGFGASLAALNDTTLAVGVPGISVDGNIRNGSVFVLFLDTEPGVPVAVQSYWVVNQTSGGFGGVMEGGPFFGRSLARASGLIDDPGGGLELLVGASGDDDGGPDRGAFWVVSLDMDVADAVEIAEDAFIFVIDSSRSLVSNEMIATLPTAPRLLPNYPNPFNPQTTVYFSLPQSQTVRLQVFDAQGRRITELVNRSMPAGVHTVQFNAVGLASGLYLLRLETDYRAETRHMLLVK